MTTATTHEEDGRMAAGGALSFVSVTAVAFTGWILATLLFASLRGAWMDEFATYQMTDPGTTLHQHMITRWMTDQHPPTYYFLQWLWRSIFSIDRNVFAMRLLSLVLSVIFAAGALRAYKSLFGSITAFAVIMCSSPVLIYFSGEARSYFISFFGGIYLGMFFIWCLSSPPTRRGWVLPVSVGIVGALLCTVHLISLLIGGYCLAMLMLIGLYRRDWPVAIAAFCLGFFVILPGLGWTLFVLVGMRDAIQSFWITRWDLLEAIVWLPAFLGLPTLMLGAMILLRKGLPESESTAASLTAARWAVVVSIAFVALAVVLSLAKPFLVIRYLAALAGFLVCPVALALDVKMRGWTHATALAVTLGSLLLGAGLAAATPHSSGEWRAPGQFVASLPACRGATIPVGILTTVQPQAAMSTWGQMFGWYAGDDDRFRAADPATIAATADQPCPVRLWIGDFVERYLTDEMRTAIRLVCEGHKDVDVLAFRRGYLLLAPPGPASASWRGDRSSCAHLVSLRHRNAPPGSP